MKLVERKVAADGIDSGDKTFQITTRGEIDRLAASIEELGLITPPILQAMPEEKSGYRIVSGFRRVAACRGISEKWMIARIYVGEGNAEREKIDCARIAIGDNSFQRKLNLIETARALSLLSELFPGPDDLVRQANLLSLPDNRELIRKIVRILSMPDALQAGILAETLPLAIALELFELEEKEAGIALALLFHDLKPSLSKQREILALAREIAILENASIQAVLESERITAILKSSETDRNRKAERIRSCLKEWRFPALSAAEKSFEALVKSLELGNANEVRLIPPPFFEGREYTLSLSFKNRKELEARASTLNRLTGDEIFRRYFDSR